MEHENKKEWLQRPPTAQHELLDRLEAARVCIDAHVRLVRPDALYERPIHERHRIVFYLGHVDAFDWNLLGVDSLGLATDEPELDRLFAFGIDPVDGAALPSDAPSDWPSVDHVAAYVRKRRRQLDEALRTKRAREILADGARLNVAIEHRLMHAETFSYLLHRLPYEQKLTSSSAATTRRRARARAGLDPARVVDVPQGRTTLGATRGSGAFGWDNEFDATVVDVAPFRVDAYPVDNRRYLKFVEAGGYETRALWSETDWEWRRSSELHHPVSWIRTATGWTYRGQLREVPLPLDAPAYVSHAEASAYARWRGARLPTEAEWHRAAYGVPGRSDDTDVVVERAHPWGDAPPQDGVHGTFDFATFEPDPVGSHPAGASAFGVHDLVGNGWEWTSTPFAPLPGFRPFPFYRGYSADFFDGKHFVLKGGSPRTAACMLRRSFRNWFQAHYPHVYATFRCVEA